MPAVKLTWYQGESKPEIWKTKRHSPGGPTASLFIGDKGMLLADYNKFVLLPEKKFADFKLPEPTLPRVDEPLRRVDRGVQGRARRCLANFEYSGWLTEANHLGNVAYRVGKKLSGTRRNWRRRTRRRRASSSAASTARGGNYRNSPISRSFARRVRRLMAASRRRAFPRSVVISRYANCTGKRERVYRDAVPALCCRTLRETSVVTPV